MRTRLFILSILVSNFVEAEPKSYFSFGAALTDLKPSTSENSNQIGWEVTGSKNLGVRFLAGHVDENGFGLELELNLMGRSDLSLFSEQGKVDYKFLGLAAIYHPFNKMSVSPYLKLGYGHLFNEGFNIRYRQVNDTQIYGALGADVSVTDDYGVRVEASYLDIDAQMYSMNIIVNLDDKPLW